MRVLILQSINRLDPNTAHKGSFCLQVCLSVIQGLKFKTLFISLSQSFPPRFRSVKLFASMLLLLSALETIQILPKLVFTACLHSDNRRRAATSTFGFNETQASGELVPSEKLLFRMATVITFLVSIPPSPSPEITFPLKKLLQKGREVLG